MTQWMQHRYCQEKGKPSKQINFSNNFIGMKTEASIIISSHTTHHKTFNLIIKKSQHLPEEKENLYITENKLKRLCSQTCQWQRKIGNNSWTLKKKIMHALAYQMKFSLKCLLEEACAYSDKMWILISTVVVTRRNKSFQNNLPTYMTIYKKKLIEKVNSKCQPKVTNKKIHLIWSKLNYYLIYLKIAEKNSIYFFL